MKITKNMVTLIKDKFHKARIAFRSLLSINRRKKLKTKDFSIVSSNCLGGLLSHDFHLRFNSPTVNLYMTADDYIFFLENLESMTSQTSLLEDITEGNSYPIGLLNGKVKLYFVHYKSFTDAKVKWYERCQRLNFNKLLILFVEKDGCTYEHLKKFEALPYTNKMVIVHKDYPEIRSSYVLSEYADCSEVGVITDWRGLFGRIFGIRIYDRIDWLKIFNNL